MPLSLSMVGISISIRIMAMEGWLEGAKSASDATRPTKQKASNISQNQGHAVLCKQASFKSRFKMLFRSSPSRQQSQCYFLQGPPKEVQQHDPVQKRYNMVPSSEQKPSTVKNAKGEFPICLKLSPDKMDI